MISTIIPARIGSRGVPRKNLAMLGPKTLLQHAIDVAQHLNYPIFVTTDSDEIAAACREYARDVHVIFAHPPLCHGDRSRAIDVWRVALKQAEKIHGTHFELSVYLEPSSPFRTVEMVEDAIEKMMAGDYDLVMSVEPVPLKFCAYRQYERQEDADTIQTVVPIAAQVDACRQGLPTTYVKNGGVYVGRRHHLVSAQSLTPDDALVGHLITDHLINIDTMEDLQEARRCFTLESTPA